MTKKMLIDASQEEEIRVAVLKDGQLEEFESEAKNKQHIRGNIYLAKIARIEPAIQAAFVEYGSGRQGFLSFNEIHPSYFNIPIEDRLKLIKQTDDAPPTEGLFDADEVDDLIVNAELDNDAADIVLSNADDLIISAAKEEDSSNKDIIIGDDISFVFDDALASEAISNEDDSIDDSIVISFDEDSKSSPKSPSEPKSTFHPRSLHRHYKIQEVIKRDQLIMVQVLKEERRNKAAAVTSYLSLAGRYCVLMPNSQRGIGVSRKITDSQDRNRLKDLLSKIPLPKDMGVVIRTAGMNRGKEEIQRDLEYLQKLWKEITDLTVNSTAPALIYEEGDLIKRSLRDIYDGNTEEILISGEKGYKDASSFMDILMPGHGKKVHLYRNNRLSLFRRFDIEQQVLDIQNPTVKLKSGGYLVMCPTEALVAIDVNSGKSTKERHIADTALKTNLEAADAVARQLRLRDLSGIIAIDFIDMEDQRHNTQVEKRFRDAIKDDRARIQIGKINEFGLLVLSRQRLRPSLMETSSTSCPYCQGSGVVYSTDLMALKVLRIIEEEGVKENAKKISISVTKEIGEYLLNYKRNDLQALEKQYSLSTVIKISDDIIPPAFKVECLESKKPPATAASKTEDVTQAKEEKEGKERKKQRRRGKNKKAEESSAIEGNRAAERPVEEQATQNAQPTQDGKKPRNSSAPDAPQRDKRNKSADNKKVRQNRAPKNKKALDPINENQSSMPISEGSYEKNDIVNLEEKKTLNEAQTEYKVNAEAAGNDTTRRFNEGRGRYGRKRFRNRRFPLQGGRGRGNNSEGYHGQNNNSVEKFFTSTNEPQVNLNDRIPEKHNASSEMHEKDYRENNNFSQVYQVSNLIANQVTNSLNSLNSLGGMGGERHQIKHEMPQSNVAASNEPPMREPNKKRRGWWKRLLDN